MPITALPVEYDGIQYRSVLEADWACTFKTRLGWYFEYESHPVIIDEQERYDCDFYLPAQNVWAEAKGAHNERISKPQRLFRDLREDAEKPGGELVVVLRAADGQLSANWEHVYGDFRVAIAYCTLCDKWAFTQPGVDGDYCRICDAPGVVDLSRSYIPATAAHSFERNWAHAYQRRTGIAPTQAQISAAFTEAYGTYGRLPFARAPRNTHRFAA